MALQDGIDFSRLLQRAKCKLGRVIEKIWFT